MNNDGRVIIEISPDSMLVRATFSPPVSDGRPISQEDVDYELRSAGVVDGVLWDVIAASIRECNENNHLVRNVTIAKGIHPRPAMPAVLVFPPRIQQIDPSFLPPELQDQNKTLSAYFLPNRPKAVPDNKGKDVGSVDEHGNIDFRETHGVFVIQEGQVLAALRPAIEGIPGRTVQGGYVPFPTLQVTAMNPGANTELREGRLYATVNGQLLWNSNSFWVEENLELAIDVGYKTGNIKFPGNLLLKAGIKDRFKVWVGGNLEANGIIDAYEVFCGKDLTAKAGIIGHGKGLVRCKGTVNVKFVENAIVESLGPIIIENTALHASLYSEDRICTGDKGKLVGGICYALNGMEVNNLGNAAGSHTEVVLGVDYVQHRKMDHAREKFQDLTRMVQQLDERLDAHIKGVGMTELPQTVKDQRDRLSDEARKYQLMMSEVAEQVRDNVQATLKVKGTCFPGVRITICGASLEVARELKNVEFMLGSDQKKVLSQSLTPAKK